MDAPILIDTDAETSVDLDEPFQQIPPGGSSNATKSVFNITLDNLSDEFNAGHLKKQETRLEKEIQDWSALWLDLVQKMKDANSKNPTIDSSILPPEKRAHLDKAPNLQKFMRDSLQFQQRAHIFLNLEFIEFYEMYQNVVEICLHRTDMVQYKKIMENLANKKSDVLLKERVEDFYLIQDNK